MEITARFYDALCDEARYIREEVFVKEQGFENEFDETDGWATHLVLFCDGHPAAVARMFELQEQPGVFMLGRIAVLPQYRLLHLGSRLLAELAHKAAELGAKRIELSAQSRVQHFYEKNGFTAVGEPYMDEHCEHIYMVKQISTEKSGRTGADVQKP